MKKLAWIAVLLAVAIASFVAGRWISGGREAGAPGPGQRQVLYYVDPMNPALKSDKPGIAPCGMPLEPVYADDASEGAAGASGPSSMPPGTVRITAEKQQLIGVRTGEAERKAVTRSLRMLGRVVPDETRLYRLNSVTEGWIRDISAVTTGSLVKKGDFLAAYFSQEILGPQQAYIYALEALDRFIESGSATPEQIALNRGNVQNTRQILLNLGLDEVQAEEIAKKRKPDKNVVLRSPVTGFVLARNVSAGQRFDRTTELYVIADLGRVWILADVYEDEGQYLQPGMRASVSLPYQRKAFEATVSHVPPQFDAASRSLKVRLEADNPGFALRPDMFVDVEVSAHLPETLVVPVDAVLASGMEKTVFVDRGEGFFEPRKVETGWRLGDQMEITRGLMPGERIVLSGNFFIDSETKMKAALGGMTRPASEDPVCGMDVDEAAARAKGRVSEHGGRTYFFCADGCKEAFDKDPGAYVRRHREGAAGRDHPGAGGQSHD